MEHEHRERQLNADLKLFIQTSSKTLLVLTANPSAMGNSIEIGLLPV